MNDPIGVLTDSAFREAAVKMMQMLMGPATITQVGASRALDIRGVDGSLGDLEVWNLIKWAIWSNQTCS